MKVMILNFLVAGAKIIVGFLAGSLSISADGIHSLFDGLSSAVGIVGFTIAKKPADKEHPRGHQRAEQIAAFLVAIFIVIAAWEFGKAIWERAWNPIAPQISITGFLFVGGAFLVDILTFRYESNWAKKLQSTFLKADATHTKSHMLTTSSVLAGMAVTTLGFPTIDIIIATLILTIVVKFGVEVGKEAIGILLV